MSDLQLISAEVVEVLAWIIYMQIRLHTVCKCTRPQKRRSKWTVLHAENLHLNYFINESEASFDLFPKTAVRRSSVHVCTDFEVRSSFVEGFLMWVNSKLKPP